MKRPSKRVLENFIEFKRAALTSWLLAENLCGFHWRVMEMLKDRSKRVGLWKKDLSLYYSSKTKSGQFRPGDPNPSRMAIEVQRLMKKCPQKDLLLVPISLFLGPTLKEGSKNYYEEESWKTIHLLGLLVNLKTKTYYLFDPSATLSLFSSRAKRRLTRLFKFIGIKEEPLCELNFFIKGLARDDEDLCVSWATYFFGLTILNPQMKTETIRANMTYRGLVEFLYYLYTAFRWPFDEGACAIFSLGPTYPEILVEPGETLQEASTGLEPHEFEEIDILGVHSLTS